MARGQRNEGPQPHRHLIDEQIITGWLHPRCHRCRANHSAGPAWPQRFNGGEWSPSATGKRGLTLDHRGTMTEVESVRSQTLRRRNQSFSTIGPQSIFIFLSDRSPQMSDSFIQLGLEELRGNKCPAFVLVDFFLSILFRHFNFLRVSRLTKHTPVRGK